MNFSNHFSDAANRMQPAAIRSIFNRMQPGTISFAPGMPAFSTFPVERIKAATAAMDDEAMRQSMQYTVTEGYLPLREWVARQMPVSTATTADNVQVISGCQQAIDLMGRVFLNPGDKVAVSAPTYTGGLSTLSVYGAEFVEIACDDEGMLPESVEAALQQSPKFIYCIPNFMNPTGVDMCLERRQAVVDLARQYEVPILEDDPYGELRYKGDPVASLYELGPDCVVYAGTFSKVFAPGFRVGWLVAPIEAKERLTRAKQTSDLQVSGYTQRLLFDAAQDGFLQEQIARVRGYYYDQRNLMMEGIDQYFPPEVNYVTPSGGMFVWCELPERIDATELLETALDRKIAYVPGTLFYASDSGKNTLRLSFSLASAQEIDEGLKRLGNLFAEVIG